MRSYLILGMAFLFLIQYFAQNHWLQYIVVILAILAFLSSAGKASRFPRFLGIAMMGVGMAIEWSKGTGVEGISEGIFLILPLLCLLALAPLLSIPLKLLGYFQSVSLLLRKLLNQPKKLYAGITGTLFLISPILNLGSVRIIHEFLEDLKLPSAMTAKGYVVGFSTALMWSPYFASVSLVLFYLDVPFREYMIYGIGLSVLSLLIGNILFALWEKRNPIKSDEITSREPLEKGVRNRILKLILFVLILIATCLIVESMTHWSMIVIVCLASVIVPLFYGILSWDWKRMNPLFIDFRDRTVPMLNNEIMLFMGAGMLAFALKGTTIMNGLSKVLIILANQSFLLFAITVMLIVLLATYIGIHQIAAIGSLAMQLSAVEIGISHLSLAMILMVSWAISTALSPFSGLNLMVSRFAGLSGVKTGLRVNGLQVFIFATISLAIISIIG
jgi:hypothetical protein